VAGGLHRALERGAHLGCGAVQIFLKNQRQWRAPPLTEEAVRAWTRARRGSGIRATFAHASYLINLAAPSAVAWGQAVDAFTDELERAEALGLGFVVIHPGSHLGTGAEAGLARVVTALDECIRRTAGYRVAVALENTAGGGHTIGRRFEELAAMLGAVARPERVGACIDTCHLHAAGYDIRRPAGYAATMGALEELVGVERVLAFHLNDARAPLGSQRDRHENIGAGGLGLAPFRALLNDGRFAGVPKVLETPKDPEPVADRRNLATLRRLRRRPAALPSPATPRRRPT
jgi:deoxyribonuclease-4